jgi:CBS domain-containing protein
MVTADRNLFRLCAADLMSRNVKTIPFDMPLQAAARLLSEARISGAPVVDSHGRCLGVLSATDFVHWVKDGGQTDRARAKIQVHFCSEWEVVNLELLPKEEVRWHMTPGPVTVAPDLGITEVARIMLESHIHRVIVVDEMQRPIGIVTSTDLLAALASAQGDPSRTRESVEHAEDPWATFAELEGRDVADPP